MIRSRKIKAEVKVESKEELKESSQEHILIAATYEETDEKEELRIKNWDQDDGISILLTLEWNSNRSPALKV